MREGKEGNEEYNGIREGRKEREEGKVRVEKGE